MKRTVFQIFGLMLLLTLNGCSYRLTDFTVISTKNIPLGETGDVSFKSANQRVSGEDKAHMILYIPIGSPNMKEAIDRAIEKYPGAVGLVDGVIKQKTWWAILYGQNSYIVEGTPIYIDESSVNDKNEHNADRTFEAVPSSVPQTNAVLFFHNVRAGDNLNGIAKLYNVSVADIIKWNELSSSELKVGDKLRVYITE